MFGCCYSLYGSKILKLFHFVTFWLDKWSAPRNYLRFRQIKKMKQFFKHIFKDIFLIERSIPWVMICEMWIIRNIERYYIMKLVIVNFACYRRSLLLFVKQNKSQLMSTGQCPGSNLSPLCLRLSFIPLSHWGNGVIRENWMTCLILYPFCWVASCSFISLYLLPVTAKFGGFPCRCLSPKLTKNAAALHFYSWKEHQLSREDLWILISQFFLGQTLHDALHERLVKLLNNKVTMLQKQGRIHGYPSRVRVGRGCIWDHLIIWVGAVRPKTAKKQKK